MASDGIQKPGPTFLNPTEEESRGLQIAELHARFTSLRRILDRRACEDLENELQASRVAIKQLQEEVLNQQQLLKRTRDELKARLSEVVAERNKLQEQLLQASKLLAMSQKGELILSQKLEQKEQEMKAASQAAQAAAMAAAEDDLRSKLAEIQKLAADAMEQFQNKLTTQVVRYEVRMTAQLAHKEEELCAAKDKIAELERQLLDFKGPVVESEDTTVNVQSSDVPASSESSSLMGVDDAWSTVSLQCSISLHAREDEGASSPSLANATHAARPATPKTPARFKHRVQQENAAGPSDQDFEFATQSPRITAHRQLMPELKSARQAFGADITNTEPPTPSRHGSLPSAGTTKSLKPGSQLSSFPGFMLRDNTPRDSPPKSPEDGKVSLLQRQREQEAALLESLSHRLGFRQGQPVAAQRILQFLDEWDVLPSGSSSILQRIVEFIDQQIHDPYADDDVLAYWLTAASAMLCVIRKSVNAPPRLLRTYSQGKTGAGIRLPAFLSWKAKDADGDEESTGGAASVTWFQCQLEQQVCQLLGRLRSNSHHMLTHDLEACVGKQQSKYSFPKNKDTENGSATEDGRQSWDKVIATLESLRLVVSSNHVPFVLSATIFQQLLGTINAQLFNQLLLQQQLCTFSQGQSIRAGLAMLETWLEGSQECVFKDAMDETRQLYQAVLFLVLANKANKTFKEIQQYWCPDLTNQQLYRLAKAFQGDQHHTESVSSMMLQHMRMLIGLKEGEEDPPPELLPDSGLASLDISSLLMDMENSQEACLQKPVQEFAKYGQCAGQGMFAFWEKGRTNMQNIMSVVQANVFPHT